MKKWLAVFGLMLGFIGISRAGTPQENYYQGQTPLSGATILTSTATPTSVGTFTLVVATPTVINSGGSTYNGRNCFTRFVVQVATGTVFTIADNNTTVWTLYGQDLGSTSPNTISLPEDHLGPFCTAAGDRTVFTLTNAVSSVGVPASINVEGYTTYGGTNNQGPMY